MDFELTQYEVEVTMKATGGKIVVGIFPCEGETPEQAISSLKDMFASHCDYVIKTPTE